MKQKLKQTLAGLLAAGMLACPALAASFPDVSSSADYAEAVEYVSDIGLMVGDEQGKFNPNKTVTRAEMAAIICRMLGETEGLSKSGKFSDVPTSHWANPYVAKAAELGIVSGYGDGKFGPSDTVTYEQAVTMIVRAAYGSEAAELLGGYPNGYVTVAKNNYLLYQLNASYSSDMSRASVAQLLYNYYCQEDSYDEKVD